jgi:DNA mismatch endonuclease (patch repair protein)
MSLIRSKDTKPEKALRKALHRLGLRYSLRNKHLPGKPDIVFPRHKVALFVHGCFWHRHGGCKVATTPKSNTNFWLAKFERNVARDLAAREALAALGWRVEVAWECELGPRNISSTAHRLYNSIILLPPPVVPAEGSFT